MEIIKEYRDIINALRNYLPKLTKAQIKRVSEITDDLQLAIYLISAYNVYEISHHMMEHKQSVMDRFGTLLTK